MKKDQYIPHEVSMRNTTEVMNLIEHEGMAGYGIYWALMEYLRTQDDYTGDVRVLRSLARQLKVRLAKLLKILQEYGLFVCNEYTFRSPKLDEVMKPFEDRRAKIEAYKRNKREDKSQEIKDTTETISFEGKGKGEGKVKASEEEEGVDWEKQIDALANEQQWIEIMAMRSGLGRMFVKRFGEVLRHFKHHVLAVGNEKHIRSLGDAKHYFNNFNTPGSATFVRLVAELQKPIDRGKFRYEDRDAVTGKRSYCGVPIPDDAPPRPNGQAVWCEEKRKWVY